MSAPGPTLETERLVLVPCTEADVDRLHAHWTDPVVRRWLWDDVVIAREQAAEVVHASLESFAGAGTGFFVMRLRKPEAGDGFAGCIGLREIEPGGEIELLYSLEPALHGRGLATEAARAVLADGFERARLARIAGRVDSPNRASVRVLERLGMRAEGERPVDGRPTLHFMLRAP